MAFSEQERQALLTVKGVGNTVIQRLEQIGIDSFLLLAESNAKDITYQVAGLLGTSCWKNSPQAQAAISGAIAFAKRYCKDN